MEFEVKITATYTRVTYVEAQNWEEAEDKVNEMLVSGEIDPVRDFDDATTILEASECN